MAAPKRKGTANKVPRGNHRLWGFRFGVPCNGLLNLSLGVFSMGLGGIEFSLVIDFSLNLPWVGSARGQHVTRCSVPNAPRKKSGCATARVSRR